MWRVQRSDKFLPVFGRDEFIMLLSRFHGMKEGERKRFMADPENTDILRLYDRYRGHLRLLFITPMLALFAFSVGAGLLLVQ